MQEQRIGVLAMIGACSIWGLSPLYYKLLADVPPLEVLAHRTLWSMLFFAGVLLVQGRLGALRDALSTPRRIAAIGFAAIMISCNWFLFILSIQIERATEASLGYYIFPLVAVLLGVLFFRERLGRAQMVAVGLATIAVLILSVQLGHPPWVSLIISLTFGLYGVAKKRLSVGPVVSVTGEVLLLTPLALGWLWHLHGVRGTGLFGQDGGVSALLIVSGPLTALPLILFSFASQRVNLSSIGLIQYLNPTLQFLVATLVFREPFGTVQAVAFALIWTALAIYSTATLRAESARRKAAIVPDASGET
ncbi:chloramphenicol-sensitive protein RarD [Roseivivax halotolerans]|jgi:chloramphenicol-sensitive protein RarD|uniref:Chloramphenicol-sensitive protein RarD n=1 Tax=Roseivivax halotolerans TaxID=93684 RepID=A0A1I5ZYN3_9RHOB|nr:EamA family transporter RarD [Roseivivax halotolerans]SFQ61512.1 chloramphenicol-sensitive protein RarD [Roseivivax halotolerans]